MSTQPATTTDAISYMDNHKFNVTYTFDRLGRFPLEKYSIFPDLDSAKKYVNGEKGSNYDYRGRAYEGQVIAVQTANGQELYVIDNTATDGLRNVLDGTVKLSDVVDEVVPDSDKPVAVSAVHDELEKKQDATLVEPNVGMDGSRVTAVHATYNGFNLSTNTVDAGIQTPKLQFPTLTADATIMTNLDQIELTNVVTLDGGGSISADVEIHNANLSVANGKIVGGSNSIAIGDNSFAYGTGVSAIGENAYAVGKDSIAGCYGWYYKYLDLATGAFYLTTEQPDVRKISDMGSEPEVDTTFESGFAIGDVISYVNKNKRDMYATITEVTGNKIVVGQLTDSEYTLEEEHPNHDDWTIFVPAKPNVGEIWLGECAFAEGSGSKAINAYSHAEGGKGCLAYGEYSHAEGKATEAGYAAHTEGEQTKAKGARSHAEGYDTIASGSSAHTEGQHTKAAGQAAHAEGHSAIAVADDTVNKNADGIIADWEQQKFSLAKGTASHVEGKDNLGLGEYSHAEGFQTTALGNRAHSEGVNTIASGTNAHAEGSNTQATQENSHAEGSLTQATGSRSHAEGSGSEASQNNAHAEGMNTKACSNSAHAEGTNTVAGSGDRPSANTSSAEGNFSHAEGNGTFAKGNSSHAEGKSTQALKPYSHAEGFNTTADGNKAHAEGWQTTAAGEDSHTEGGNTQTQNRYEHAQGSYNKSNKANTTFGNAGNTIHSIGIGTSESSRKNAVEVMQNGKVFIKDAGGYDGTNPTGSGVKDLVSIISELATTSYVDGKYDEANSWWTSFIQGGFAALNQAHFTDNTYALPNPNEFASNPTLMAATIYAIASCIVIAAKPSNT